MGLCASDTSVKAEDDHSFEDELGDTGYGSSRKPRSVNVKSEMVPEKASETAKAEKTSNKSEDKLQKSGRLMRTEYVSLFHAKKAGC